MNARCLTWRISHIVCVSLVLVIWTYDATARVSVSAEELAIISALLADSATVHGWPEWPRDLTTETERFEVARKTDLRPGNWDDVKYPHVSVHTADGHSVIPIAPELVADIIERNRHSVSIDRLQLPVGIRWLSTGPRPRDNDITVEFTVSRPGIALDQTHAIIAISAGTHAGSHEAGTIYEFIGFGYTAYLEKREGRWMVLGRSLPWMT